MATDDPTPKPRLSQRVLEALQVRRYSPRTCEAYLDWIRRYWQFCGRRDPANCGAPEVTDFLTHLAVHSELPPPPRARRWPPSCSSTGTCWSWTCRG